MLSASLIQLEYASKHWKSTFSYWWHLVVGGVWGRSARWLPSHTLVLLVHGGLWSGGVGWWVVVVVGVVLVVVLVGPLVVVALVVVRMVLRVLP